MGLGFKVEGFTDLGVYGLQAAVKLDPFERSGSGENKEVTTGSHP